MNINEIDILFKQYGYELKEQNDSYRIYLLHQGMYFGAEILMLDETDSNELQKRYSKLGYSTKVQHFSDINQAEDYLFKGFFKTEFTTLSIQRRYEEFSQKQIKHYANPDIKYEYIDVPFVMYSENDDEGNDGAHIIDSINNFINKPGAQLIIVEAAAGFGKTCTAFELYNSFQRFSEKAKPLFTELSRNREAKLFKYVLLSEIDNEYKSTISNDLVIYNIRKGRIPLIIDGFDELLSKDIDPGKVGMLNEFEQVETMLSTIGDLLTENAKIILTSRRTAIFAGTEFSEWVESYNGNFNVVRFQIDKPNIKQWLKPERYEIINSNNVPLEHISNPVLLTYLRNVPESDFIDLIKQPESITEKYFEYLLNREQERQGLIIPYKDQLAIFENLAKMFLEFNITGDTRSFIKELIIEYNKSKLLYYRELTTTKQTIEELADTLTNHALLDRINNNDYVGFVNEFVFGYLLGKAIVKDNSSFLQKDTILSEDLLELAILAFRYSYVEDRNKLWEKLSVYKRRMSIEHSLLLDSTLKNAIYNEFNNIGINSLNFDGVIFSKDTCKFTDVSFVDVVFEKCKFDLNAFHKVTFTGCKFKNCNIDGDKTNIAEHHIHCYGCEDYSSNFIELFEAKSHFHVSEAEQQKTEMQILNKYFKVDGKSTKMRYISYLKSEFDPTKIDEMFQTFNKLKKQGYINTRGNNSFITQTGINYYHKNCKL